MKEGYKQTEIGVIPEDWDIGSLKEAFPRLDAGVSVNSDESVYSDYFVLKTSAVRNGIVNVKEAKPVVRADYPRLKCPVKKGSIIISRMNTPTMVGECGFSSEEALNTFLPDRLWQVEPLVPDYDFQWLNYLLNTEKYSAAIRATATGTSNSMKNIAKDRLLEILIPKPTLPEQQRIAEALSDMDELIASLEKLIAKKKAIKQGAMQELLTGNRRLPGFSGEWEESKIGEMGFFYNGLSGKKKNDFGHGKSRYITFLNVLSNVTIDVQSLEYVEVGQSESQNQIRKGDLFFNTSSETPEEVGMCAVLMTDVANVYLNSFCFGFRLFSDDYDPLFLSYLFNSSIGRKIMNILAQGATRYNLSKGSLSEAKVKLPPIAEQIALATTLFEMDCDISVLEKKCNKVCRIKQGMMQQLLTGTIRLT